MSFPHLQGAITMENLMVRYRPELPPVIHRLSFATRAREKVQLAFAMQQSCLLVTTPRYQ